MRVAFVGKGGSGKSTITSIFSRYLMDNSIPQIIIDADINMHLNLLLQVHHDKSKSISLDANVSQVREFLRGCNKHIGSSNLYVKTTPPGIGSNFLINKSQNYILKEFSTQINSNTYFLEVGTYESEGIGTSCYHGNLSVLENVLTHSLDDEESFVVVDMVAGTDAFSNSLHLLFDAIVFVLEPTPESISVYKKYVELSKSAGVEQNLYCLLNKAEDEDDTKFVKSQGIDINWILPYSKQLRKYSQYIISEFNDDENSENTRIQLPQKVTEVADEIFEDIKGTLKDRDEILKQIHELHLKYIAQDYIVKTMGDLSDQIDTKFSFKKLN
ncbi:MAG: hypothetical protein ACMXYB_02555 [Candidatus Woesearchaeota archaeon]